MGKLKANIASSVDGYVAGPNQSEDNPIGEEMFENVGAVIMGRNMFGPIRGDWGNAEWEGWGDDPPYHVPVFVLTHHERDRIEKQGGTSNSFARSRHPGSRTSSTAS
jgi:dihydrofolate reductase